MTDEKMDARLRAAGDRWRADAKNTTGDADDASGTELLVHLPQPRSRHRWVTAVSAAAVTAALVIGGFLAFRHDDTQQNTQPLAGSEQKLIGPTWTVPDTGMTLVFTRSRVTSTFLCSKHTKAVRIGAGRLTIGDVIGTGEECSYPDPGAVKQAALQRYSDVVSGAVRWSIERNTLTLSRPGVGSVSLTRPVELSDLAGTNWGVTGTQISLVFSDDSMRVSDGCVSATYAVTIDQGRVTRRQAAGQGSACSPAPTAVGTVPTTADRFDAITDGSFLLALDGDRLTLSRSGAGTITLTAQGSAPDLVGTTWKLTGIVDGSGVSLSHVNAATTFEIDARGALTTDDQCGNAIDGSVTTTDTTFTFADPVVRTEIGCADQVLNKGAVTIGDILSGTVSWSIRGDLLMLGKAGHQGELMYEVATPKAPTNQTLAGTSWNLTNLHLISSSGANGPLGSPAVVSTQLSFGDNTLTLGDACYEITGTVAFDTGSVTLSAVTAGERPNVRCDSNGERLGQEANLRKLLSNGVVGWTVDNGALSLTRYNIVAGFEPATTSSADSLQGTSWRLSDTETESTSGNSSSGSGSSAVSRSDLTFMKNGRFTITHKCYSKSGDYTVSGRTVTFSQVQGAGAIPCPSNAESSDGQKENDVVDALLANGAATFTVRDGVLTIKKADHTADFAEQATGAAALRASHWMLTEIRDGAQTRDASGSAEFDFARKVVAAGQYTIPATINDSVITITGGRSGTQPLTKKSLNGADETFVYEKLLTGTVTYTISGDTLTLTKAGVGALVLTRT